MQLAAISKSLKGSLIKMEMKILLLLVPVLLNGLNPQVAAKQSLSVKSFPDSVQVPASTRYKNASLYGGSFQQKFLYLI
jgi:hypothetical protein